MVQRTVLKVDISCQKCRKKLLRAVSGLEGVDKIEVDDAKGTLAVTGNADPYEVIVRTRKTGRSAEVVSIGPPPPPPKQDAAPPKQDAAPPKQDAAGGQKKPAEKKADKGSEPKAQAQAQVQHVPHTCYVCEKMSHTYIPCSIQ